MSPTENPSALRRLLQTIAGSAEYAVALALLLVCGVVGAVIWFGAEEAPESPALAVGAPVAEAVGQVRQEAVEREALEDLQRQLRERMSEVEEQQRAEALRAEEARRAAEEQERLLAEQRAEEARLAEEARQRELALRIAEERQREAERARQAQLAAARVPERTDATIRWESCRQPEYPRASRAAGEEGVVVLSLEVNEYGSVTDGRVKESSGFRRLDLTTLRALMKCRFDPATENGVAMATTGEVRFAWSLQ